MAGVKEGGRKQSGMSLSWRWQRGGGNVRGRGSACVCSAKSQTMSRLEGCVEEPGLSIEGTREPWRSSEQGKDRVTLVL